jgi:hypothetical protein
VPLVLPLTAQPSAREEAEPPPAIFFGFLVGLVGPGFGWIWFGWLIGLVGLGLIGWFGLVGWLFCLAGLV